MILGIYSMTYHFIYGIYNSVIDKLALECIKEIDTNNVASTCLILENLTMMSIQIKTPEYFNTLILFLTTLPFLQTLILLDSTLCAALFTKEYFILKFSERKLGRYSSVIFDYKSDIIRKCSTVYLLATVDRYVFYAIIYFIYQLLSYLLVTDYLKVVLLLFAIPTVQNGFVRIFERQLEVYLENKEIFMKYSISKLIVSSFQGLHNDIDRVQNYHIFLIYNILSFDHLYVCFRNYILICLFYFLKNREHLYYYYKALKTAYFFNTGYNFEKMSLYDAVYLGNLIIDQDRWNEFPKMEVINMMYVLIDSKFSQPNSSLYVTGSILMLQGVSLWTFVSLCKLISLKFLDVNTTLTFFVFFVLFVSLKVYNVSNSKRRFTTSVVSYVLLRFNVNDLIITMVLLCHNVMYYTLGELYFFLRNIHSIRKVIRATLRDKNKRPKANLDINEAEKEFIFVNGK